ncbi:mast cell protease 1A-like isoform 1-T1 [Ciconia maguari]
MCQPLLALLLLLSCSWANASKLGCCKLLRVRLLVWAPTSAATGSSCGGVSCRCSTGSYCGGPRGSAPLPSLRGIPEGRNVRLRRLPGGPRLGDDSRTLHGLTAKATLNDYVKTIPLPKTSSDLPTGTKCSIAGWGLIDDDQVTNKFFEAKVSIYSRRKCIHFCPHLNTGMVCAGSFHELRDSSQGDSGGPLVCNKVAQGIVSFGYDTTPGVYTRISNYLPWIKKKP